ncbi:hypothetical protein ACFL96_04605 [Thermoproteota archaeon]
MPQIKLTVSPDLKTKLDKQAKELGVKTTEYIMSILLEEFRRQNRSK